MKVGPSPEVDGSRVPSQNSTANGRSGMRASISRRRGAVFANAIVAHPTDATACGFSDSSIRMIAAMSSTAGPLPSDIQPVENETRDRIITGLVTLVPFVAIGFAGWQVWGSALHWSDVFLFLGMYVFTGLGITVGFHRHLTHRAFKASLAARPAGDPRLGGDRGAGHLLGRRPPQAPRLLRRGGRPAQPPCRPRPRLERRPARPLPRAHGLALHPHPARQQGALRAGPAQGPDRSAGSTAPSSTGRSAACCCPSSSAGSIGGTLFAAFTGLLWGGLVRVFVLHHFTYSINSLCHVFGDRDFETGDQSRNLALIAIPTFGEAWHNNHHAFPTSATHGLGRFQVDISALVIDGLEKTGLVWDVVRVSPERMAAKATSPN